MILQPRSLPALHASTLCWPNERAAAGHVEPIFEGSVSLQRPQSLEHFLSNKTTTTSHTTRASGAASTQLGTATRDRPRRHPTHGGHTNQVYQRARCSRKTATADRQHAEQQPARSPPRRRRSPASCPSRSTEEQHRQDNGAAAQRRSGAAAQRRSGTAAQRRRGDMDNGESDRRISWRQIVKNKNRMHIQHGIRAAATRAAALRAAAPRPAAPRVAALRACTYKTHTPSLSLPLSPSPSPET